MPPTYELQLGRLKLPTVLENLAESLGDGLEVVGAQVLAGEPRARPFPVKLPVHAAPDDPLDQRVVGDRLRRQVRSLLENAPARLSGLPFRFAPDPELDCVLLIGGGDLAYSDDGAVTYGDYVLSLTDVYKVGGARTHRRVLRAQVSDRRLSTTPRDLLRTRFSTDFAAQSVLPILHLPPAVTDIAANLKPIQTVQLTGQGGGARLVETGVQDALAVSFEESTESVAGVQDVLILDRRSSPSPTLTIAGDADPQGVYGWEEVYGPDYPLTSGDVPTLQNGFCRTRWIPAQSALAIDSFDTATSLFVEQGRITIWHNGNDFQFGAAQLAIRPAVVEWTPERGVIRLTFSSNNQDRCEVYVTLQRGWGGPRVEAYPTWGPGYGTSNPPGCAIRWTPNSTDHYDVSKGFNLSTFGITDEFSWPNYSFGDFTPTFEPWWAMTTKTIDLKTSIGAVVQSAVAMVLRQDTAAYGGGGRVSFSTESLFGTTAAGYCSVQLGFVSRGRLLEAESYNTGGTNTSSADGAASGGATVLETQAAASANTLAATSGQLDTLGLAPGKYGLYARVRVGTAGATLSIRANMGGANTTPDATYTGTTYGWIFIGEVSRPTSGAFALAMWRSAGTGNTFVDRIRFVPLERRTGTAAFYDGARDLGQRGLVDVRPVQALVER